MEFVSTTYGTVRQRGTAALHPIGIHLNSRVSKSRPTNTILVDFFFIGREAPSETFALESRKAVSQHVPNRSGTDACGSHSATNTLAPQSIHRITHGAFLDPTVPSPRSDLAHHDTSMGMLDGQSLRKLRTPAAYQLKSASYR